MLTGVHGAEKPKSSAPKLARRFIQAKARRGARTYYTFRIPGSAREVSLGSDLNAAKQAVALYFSQQADDKVVAMLNRIEQPVSTVAEHIEWFADTELPERRTRKGHPLAKKTLYEYRLMLEHTVSYPGGDRSIADVTRRSISAMLESYPPRMSNRYRSLLSQVFRYAIARGLRSDNPLDATIARNHAVERQRQDRPSFDAIHEAAPPWLKRAMAFSLWSLQRRENVVLLHIDGWQNGVLSVRQQKGEGTGLLRITPGNHLRVALTDCLNSPESEDCPYLIYRQRVRRKKTNWHHHPFQVSGEKPSRDFTELPVWGGGQSKVMDEYTSAQDRLALLAPAH